VSVVDAWAEVFEGFEQVPWSSLQHAYGPAGDVLIALPELASDDAEERENALGFFWHSVHHQGDIYDSTIAALPFLVRAAVAADFPDRAGILDLLASIAGYSLGGGGATEPAAQEARWLPFVRQAYDGVMAGTPGYLAALSDPDVQVRAAAVEILQCCRRERASIMSALRAALSAESDPEVQVALINAYLAVASDDSSSATSIDESAQQWLLDLLTSGAERPHIRLAALIQVAERIPERLPADVVDVALDLAGSMYTDTDEPEEDDSAGGLLASLDSALGERAGDRMVLISHELDAGRGERAEDALRLASRLMRDFRADYTELVRRVGGHLAHASEPNVRWMAAHTLEGLYELAAPAADVIAEVLADGRREYVDDDDDRLAVATSWIIVHESASPRIGALVATLARARDPRVVPILRQCLEYPTPIWQLGYTIGAAGPVAAELVGPIREQISRLTDKDRDLKIPEQLAFALGRIGPAALAAAPDLVAMLEDDRANFSAATALGSLGPAAASAPGAVDGLRRMLDHPDRWTAVIAATALARISPDDALLRPVFERVLADPDAQPTLAAAEGLALLGPGPGDASDALLARLDQMLDGSDFWAWLTAAIALWYTTGDSGRAVPAMARAWTKAHHTRRRIAHSAADIGPAAVALEPLLRAESASVRRHNRPAGATSSSTADVAEDEELLRDVRVALEKITNP
jgi:hypothetical protein